MKTNEFLTRVGETKYFVNQRGTVYNSYNLEDKAEWFKLSPFKLNSGYSSVTIAKQNILLHHLVYTTFIGDIPKGMTINHKDLDINNNHVSNLELCSYKEQISHYKQSIGEPIYYIQLTLEDGTVTVYETMKAVADYLGQPTRGSIPYYLKKGNHNGIEYNKIFLKDYKS